MQLFNGLNEFQLKSPVYLKENMNSTIRDSILDDAISELAHNGSEFFNTSEICRRLHISRSLVNHHFGSQSGLIAEAAVVSYEHYIELLADAARAQTTPSARLEAWMQAQHEWFVENRGTAALLQMPHVTYAKVMYERFGKRLQDGFRLNMAVLATLVRDVQTDTISPLDFTVENAPFDELLGQNVEVLMRTASVGMSSLGASVWAAGRAMPSRDIEESYLQTASLAQHRKWVVRAILATK